MQGSMHIFKFSTVYQILRSHNCKILVRLNSSCSVGSWQIVIHTISANDTSETVFS